MADGELVFGGDIEPIMPLKVYQVTMAAMEARKKAPRREAAMRRSEAGVRLPTSRTHSLA